MPAQPPWASSAGLGEVLLATLKRSDRVVIGLGGSATVDLGTGLATALGVVLRDDHGQTVVTLPAELPGHGRVVAWCDVDASLLAGPETGLNRLVSGRNLLRQKGVTQPEDVEADWRRVLDALRRAGLDVDPLAPGSGAAGGLGLMLKTLLGAPLLSGADAVLDTLHFDALLEQADLVLTGEGRFDAQSLAGKGPGRVIQRATQAGVPAVVLAGQVQAGLVLPGGVQTVAVSNPQLSLSAQLADTLNNVRTATRRVCSQRPA